MVDYPGTADPRVSAGSGEAKTRFDEAAASTKSLGDRALAAGQELADKAKDIAATSTGAIKGQASDMAEAAKGVASQAADKLKDAVEERKSSGAEYVGSLAETMRRAAREFDADLPIAATYIRKAASQVDGFSDNIRAGHLDDVIRNAQSFARRQPTAFLGIAVLAGFGAVRFLKSSSSSAASNFNSENSRSTAVASSSRAAAGNQGYRDEFQN